MKRPRSRSTRAEWLSSGSTALATARLAADRSTLGCGPLSAGGSHTRDELDIEDPRCPSETPGGRSVGPRSARRRPPRTQALPCPPRSAGHRRSMSRGSSTSRRMPASPPGPGHGCSREASATVVIARREDQPGPVVRCRIEQPEASVMEAGESGAWPADSGNLAGGNVNQAAPLSLAGSPAATAVERPKTVTNRGFASSTAMPFR